MATVPDPLRTVIPQRELRNNVSEVLRRAEAGERITITVNGRPVAELGPLTPAERPAKRGTAEGLRRIQALAAQDPSFAADIKRMREEDRANAVDVWAQR